MKAKNSVDGRPYAPFLSMCISCFLWASYGCLFMDPTIIMTNAVGLGLSLYYVYCYFSVAKLPERVTLTPFPAAACSFARCFSYYEKFPVPHNLMPAALLSACGMCSAQDAKRVSVPCFLTGASCSAHHLGRSERRWRCHLHSHLLRQPEAARWPRRSSGFHHYVCRSADADCAYPLPQMAPTPTW